MLKKIYFSKIVGGRNLSPFSSIFKILKILCLGEACHDFAEKVFLYNDFFKNIYYYCNKYFLLL